MHKVSRVIYHQRETLLTNIRMRLQTAAAESLLDIGAGSSASAVPLSRTVRRYLAIEKEPEAVAELQEAGVAVVLGAFPLALDETFDFVLSSHSIPERAVAAYPAFMSAVFNAVRPGGRLLIVTFKGAGGELEAVARDVLGRVPSPSPELAAMRHFFRGVGVDISIDRVNSYAEAESADALADFMLPWFATNDRVVETLRGPLTRIAEMRFRVRQELFVFPTEHLFLSCMKPLTPS